MGMGRCEGGWSLVESNANAVCGREFAGHDEGDGWVVEAGLRCQMRLAEFRGNRLGVGGGVGMGATSVAMILGTRHSLRLRTVGVRRLIPSL